eukprot:12533442-Prorocentrum_lima.AAC.1
MKKFNLKGGQEGVEGGGQRATLLQTPTSDDELRRGAILEIDLRIEETKGGNERRLKTSPSKERAASAHLLQKEGDG